MRARQPKACKLPPSHPDSTSSLDRAAQPQPPPEAPCDPPDRRSPGGRRIRVTTELDETTRSAAEVDAARTERANDRAAALDEKAGRKAADAGAAELRRQRDYNSLPEGGEPIRIGHRSEARHRRAHDRAWSSLGNSVEAGRDAEEAEGRAKIAANANEAHHDPVTVANRVEKLRADERRMQRRITEQTYS
ncbi:DUF3560 domain-containing protein [Pseudoclavibacter sp. JAI123]|uniref:DUF3560 domain-containing protein n=1 Tax=Pseudoclavibacter sp. JAI123 TaxID=2723065 RepID=UPI0015CDC0B7